MQVLVADDDPAFRLVLRSMIEDWGHEVTEAANGEQAWEILREEGSPSLAVIDWIMPELDGLELCHRIRAHHSSHYTYIIVLTSLHETDYVVKAIEAGADDYVTKPCKSQELRVRLRAGERLVELNKELRYKATRDALTGAFNRAYILEMLEREISRSARSDLSTGVVMIDIDLFKRINDTHGHAAGDAVLVEVCRRLTEGLRRFDTLGRLGGEEFLIVLPECDAPEAMNVAERLRQSIAEIPMISGKERLEVTASFGVAAAPPAPAQFEAFLHSADLALYEAKRNGRNCVRLASYQTASDPFSPTAGND